MPQVINTNIASLNAQRSLNSSQGLLNTALQRLSSGLRINSAKDDAAGLAISERMTSQIRGLNQAARNANDGISLAQTAEGALVEVTNNLQRIRELAIQSANATNSAGDRAALQKEVGQLKAEIDRVAQHTSFNGTKLLDGSFTSQDFQIGANWGQTISIDKVADASLASLGYWNDGATFVSFGTPPAAPAAIAAGAFSINGVKIGAVTAGGSVPAQGVNVAAAINEKTSETGVTATADSTGAITLTSAGSITVDGTLTNTGLVKTSTDGGATVIGALPAAAAAIAADAFSINGVKIGAVVAGADVAGQGANVAAAINEKTSETGVTATADTTGFITLTSANGIVVDGTLTNTGLTAIGNTGFADLTVSTVEDADKAILAMDAALNAVNSARADLGAIQNRFSSVVSNLQTSSENLSASRSRIIDADFAEETAALTRAQILQQAGVAMLAQANALPNNVLSLLR